MERLLSIRDTLTAATPRLEGEEVPLAAAAGRFLAAPAHALRAAPPETCSAMDGYAVRAAEAAGPGPLRVGQVLYAGGQAAPLPAGEAARIFTGAPLPPGADAVVPQELAEPSEGAVRFRQRIAAGANVRLAGEDVPAGGLALPAGARLGPRQRALLAAVGVERVLAVRRPRVVVLSAGDEVVAGRLPDSNGPAVAGLCQALGAQVTRLQVADRADELARALEGAMAQADMVFTIGGVSVGERDLVPAALRALGAEIRVHGVPMKPGKPFLFALRGGRPILGLPGSPSACLVAFEVFGRPALLALGGAARLHRPMVRLRLAEPLEGRPGRARLVWGELAPDGRALPLGRDTAQVRGPALADLLLCLGADAGALAAGEEVVAWLLDDAG